MFVLVQCNFVQPITLTMTIISYLSSCLGGLWCALLQQLVKKLCFLSKIYLGFQYDVLIVSTEFKCC